MFTDYLENKLLDHAFAGTAYTPPATVYLALFLSTPTDSGTGTEVTGSGYARQALTLTAAAAGAKSIVVAFDFPTALAAWGTVVAVAVYDASSGGNMLAYQLLDTPQVIAIGDIYRQSTLTITLD